MKLHRKKAPKHVKRTKVPAKGLPTPAHMRLQRIVAQTRARAGRRQ